MDLSMLQKTLETAPVRKQALAAEITAKGHEVRTIDYFLEAVMRLRVSWRDEDPGKYSVHWCCFKGERKVWPRELVDTAAVAEFDAKRIIRHPKTDPTPLVPFAELRRENCPSCLKLGLAVCSYEQTFDSPSGDTWSRVFSVLCAHCVGVYRLNAQASSGRF